VSSFLSVGRAPTNQQLVPLASPRISVISVPARYCCSTTTTSLQGFACSLQTADTLPCTSTSVCLSACRMDNARCLYIGAASRQAGSGSG